MKLFFAATLVLPAVPCMAADTSPPGHVVAHPGDMLRDVNNVRVAPVDTVNADGSVGLIVDSRYVTVPAETLSMANGKLMTSRTRNQLEQ